MRKSKPSDDATTKKPNGLKLMVGFWIGWLVFWLAITAVSHWVKPEAANAVGDVNLHSADTGVQAAALTVFASDFAGALPTEFTSQLNFNLAHFEEETSTQIALAIYPQLPTIPVEAFTIAVAEQSQLGRKGLDNGAILSIFAKDKVARLEVGYGLEGVLPDVEVRRILESNLVPAWNAGDRTKAVEDTLLAVMALVRESYKAQKLPGILTIFWRQLRVAIPKLWHGALPKLVAVPTFKRFGYIVIGGVLSTLLWVAFAQSGRFLRDSFVSAKNALKNYGTGVPPAPEQPKTPRGLLQWLNSPASPGLTSLYDLIKAGVAVAVLTSLLIGVVVTAGGGAFGGAGSLLRW